MNISRFNLNTTVACKGKALRVSFGAAEAPEIKPTHDSRMMTLKQLALNTERRVYQLGEILGYVIRKHNETGDARTQNWLYEALQQDLKLSSQQSDKATTALLSQGLLKGGPIKGEEEVGATLNENSERYYDQWKQENVRIQDDIIKKSPILAYMDKHFYDGQGKAMKTGDILAFIVKNIDPLEGGSPVKDKWELAKRLHEQFNFRDSEEHAMRALAYLESNGVFERTSLKDWPHVHVNLLGKRVAERWAEQAARPRTAPRTVPDSDTNTGVVVCFADFRKK